MPKKIEDRLAEHDAAIGVLLNRTAGMTKSGEPPAAAPAPQPPPTPEPAPSGEVVRAKRENGPITDNAMAFDGVQGEDDFYWDAALDDPDQTPIRTMVPQAPGPQGVDPDYGPLNQQTVMELTQWHTTYLPDQPVPDLSEGLQTGHWSGMTTQARNEAFRSLTKYLPPPHRSLPALGGN